MLRCIHSQCTHLPDLSVSDTRNAACNTTTTAAAVAAIDDDKSQSGKWCDCFYFSCVYQIWSHHKNIEAWRRRRTSISTRVARFLDISKKLRIFKHPKLLIFKFITENNNNFHGNAQPSVHRTKFKNVGQWLWKENRQNVSNYLKTEPL